MPFRAAKLTKIARGKNKGKFALVDASSGQRISTVQPGTRSAKVKQLQAMNLGAARKRGKRGLPRRRA